MLREYHKWNSRTLGRDMELLVFGHGGARVVVFPTSNGRFFDWENRGMISALSRHLENGWVQLYCVDSVDAESWFNSQASPRDRACRELQYQDYIIQEVLPFSHSKNDNQFVIATGASLGAYHALSTAVRFPDSFQRALGMSGVYDVRQWTGGDMDEVIRPTSPCEFIAGLTDEAMLERIRKVDLIVPIGKDDPLFPNNQWFSELLWTKGIWHAFRVWDCNAHDWPYWLDMVQRYIGGADSQA